MGDFYQDMRETASDLLAPTKEGGLGQGSIVLVRYAAAIPTPNAWSAPLPAIRRLISLDGVARGVGKEMVGTPVQNGGAIIATDLVLIVAAFDGPYEPRDVIEVDGRPVAVLSVNNIPEAGPPVAIQFVVRR